MTNANNLEQQLKNFKNQMPEVNQSLTDYERKFKEEQEKVKILRESFYTVVKLINHELLNSLDNSNEIFKGFKIVNSNKKSNDPKI
jgi:DNA-binding protein YbaB